MRRRPITGAEYRDRVKILRKYFDNFGTDRFDLRRGLKPWQKALVSRYYNSLKEIASGIVTPVPLQKYPKSARKKIQKSAHQGRFHSPHLKYALVPTAEVGDEFEVKITPTADIEIVSRGVGRLYVDFEPLEIASNPYGTAEKIIETHPDIDRWFIQAGRHEIHTNPELRNMPPNAERIARALEYLTTSYGDMRFDRNDPNSHHYANWLGGLIGYRFGEQRDFKDYQSAKKAARAERKKLREELKRKKDERERQFKAFLKGLV